MLYLYILIENKLLRCFDFVGTVYLITYKIEYIHGTYENVAFFKLHVL